MKRIEETSLEQVEREESRNIAEAKERMAGARLDFLDTYFNHARDLFIEVSEDGQGPILRRFKETLPSLLFDCTSAQGARERSGLSKTQLARELRIDLSAISRFEGGERTPSRRGHGGTYLRWLAQNGYDILF